MSHFARRPSPAMVVAVVALCFALGGSAVAGTQAVSSKLSKDETKSVKRIAKKQAKKQIRKRAPGLSVANADQLGRVPADRYQQALYAVVGADASLIRGEGAVSAELAATAHYDVTFDRNVAACAYVATIGSPNENLQLPGYAVVANDPGNPNGVRVRTHGPVNGQLQPESFHLQVAC